MLRSVVVLCCALVVFGAWGTSSALARPGHPTSEYEGVVKLNPLQRKRIDKVTCGLIAREWTPVAPIRVGATYIAHSRRAFNLMVMVRDADKPARKAALSAKQRVWERRWRLERDACKQPNGATLVAAASTRRLNGQVTCARVGSRWLPGSQSGRYFTSYSQLAENARVAARMSTRSDRLRLQKKSRAFSALHAQRQPECVALVNGSTSTRSTGTALRFSFTGAQALALDKPDYAMKVGSNLNVVGEDGSVRDATTSGKALVDRFLISPTGVLYLIFRGPVNLDGSTTDSGRGCVLASVDVSTGVPTCVDSELTSIWKSTATATAAVQFDAAGNVYYSGPMRDGHVLLRKWDGAEHRDLITDYVTLYDFLVQGSGTVFVSGYTIANGMDWLRKISPDGALHGVEIDASTFLQEFPDGNVYYGMQAGPAGVKRYLASTDRVDPSPWIAGRNPSFPAPHFIGSGTCGYSQCSRVPRPFMRTLSNRVYAITDSPDDSYNQVVRLYPDLHAVTTTAVDKVTLGQVVLNHLILTGLNAQNHYLTTLYDTSTDTEQTLIPAEQEIEVYHLCFSAGGSRVLFDGLRFADNRYVVGYVDVNTKALRVTRAFDTKWEDFQALG